jgi:hypothetical protein
MTCSYAWEILAFSALCHPALCGSGFDGFFQGKGVVKLNDEWLYGLNCKALRENAVSDLSHLFFDTFMLETAPCALMLQC